MYLEASSRITRDKIFYIKMENTPDPILEEKANDQILELLKVLVTPVEGEKAIIFGEDENTLFLILDESRVYRLINLLDTLTIEYEFTDITEDVLLGTYIDDNFNRTFKNDYIYNESLVEFIETHLDVNKVLDKICVNGMSSLNKFDYKVLESVR